jgi:hypothetical protein
VAAGRDGCAHLHVPHEGRVQRPALAHDRALGAGVGAREVPCRIVHLEHLRPVSPAPTRTCGWLHATPSWARGGSTAGEKQRRGASRTSICSPTSSRPNGASSDSSAWPRRTVARFTTTSSSPAASCSPPPRAATWPSPPPVAWPATAGGRRSMLAVWPLPSAPRSREGTTMAAGLCCPLARSLAACVVWVAGSGSRALASRCMWPLTPPRAPKGTAPAMSHRYGYDRGAPRQSGCSARTGIQGQSLGEASSTGRHTSGSRRKASDADPDGGAGRAAPR